MRQLNKDGQKQVNYVICIPPMCTEKGVRLQHKFIVDKEGQEEGKHLQNVATKTVL